MRDTSKFTSDDHPKDHESTIADAALVDNSDEESSDSSTKKAFWKWLLRQKWWVVLIFVVLGLAILLICKYT